MKKCILICMFFIGFPWHFSHAEANTPREQVEIITTRITKLLASPEMKTSVTKPQVINKIEEELNNFFDFNTFSSRAVGKKWRTFNEEQKQNFQIAFTNLLRNSYIETIDQYSGQTIEYVSEKYSRDKKRVEIQMLFKSNNQEYPVAFRMIQKNNTWAVYDVILEGISMIKNYREQFRTMLTSDSPDELIARIQEKALTIKNKQKTSPKK